MKSILDEISVIRKGKLTTIDTKNENRYRVAIAENDGSQTSYFFNTPIYNEETRMGVDMKFHARNGGFVNIGSNAKITVNDTIRMENGIGSCEIFLPDAPITKNGNSLVCGNLTLLPTTNGVAIRVDLSKGIETLFTLKVSTPDLGIRANGKYFALMREKLKPFLVASCIGTEDEQGTVLAPAVLKYQKIDEHIFRLSLLPMTRQGTTALFEINMYEHKLFQDTTVESASPNANNVFGAIAFLGTTPEFGEQWLYTKTDYTKIWEIEERKIRYAYLHLPYLGRTEAPVKAFGVSERFCSFGSTWNRKVSALDAFAVAQCREGYISIPLSSFFFNSNGFLLKNNGLILRTMRDSHEVAIVATADSCFFPSILEVNCL